MRIKENAIKNYIRYDLKMVCVPYADVKHLEDIRRVHVTGQKIVKTRRNTIYLLRKLKNHKVFVVLEIAITRLEKIATKYVKNIFSQYMQTGKERGKLSMMSKEESLAQNRANYRYKQKCGICPKCNRLILSKAEDICIFCREKRAADAKKKRDCDRASYNEYMKNLKHKLYEERLELGLCTLCGRERDKTYYKQCCKCRKKRSEYIKKKRDCDREGYNEYMRNYRKMKSEEEMSNVSGDMSV